MRGVRTGPKDHVNTRDAAKIHGWFLELPLGASDPECRILVRLYCPYHLLAQVFMFGRRLLAHATKAFALLLVAH